MREVSRKNHTDTSLKQPFSIKQNLNNFSTIKIVLTQTFKTEAALEICEVDTFINCFADDLKFRRSNCFQCETIVSLKTLGAQRSLCQSFRSTYASVCAKFLS